MITETDKLECEIIVAIKNGCDEWSCDKALENDMLEYLDKCFAAKRIVDEQNKLNYINQ